MSLRSIVFIPVVALLSCAAGSDVDSSAAYQEVPATTIVDVPEPDPAQSAPMMRDQAVHGRYLVRLLGCSTCHTDGALTGFPNLDLSLAGSRTGIAWSNPLGDDSPGVVYPPNITPDIETGIGAWSDQQIGDAIRAGIGKHGNRRITVMPWQGYAVISDEDTAAIVAYLRSIEPITHKVPDEVPPGQQATEPFVYFGVYESR